MALARVKSRQIGGSNGFTGKSMLGGRESQIDDLLRLKFTKANIAKICGCAWLTLDDCIKSRSLHG